MPKPKPTCRYFLTRDLRAQTGHLVWLCTCGSGLAPRLMKTRGYYQVRRLATDSQRVLMGDPPFPIAPGECVEVKIVRMKKGA